MIRAIAIALLLQLGVVHGFAKTPSTSLTRWVDPLIGTAGGGQTTPNVGVPFGMTQWTPATRNGEVRLRAPYYYKDSQIVGLRGTHFLSGSGTKDYGSFQMLAGMGKPDFSRGYLAESLDHSQEHAGPSEYRITLASGVEIAMTGTARCGFIRFRFLKSGPAWISLQNEAEPGDGRLTVNPAAGQIEGENRVRRVYAGNGQLAGFSGYVFVELQHPFTSASTWSGSHMDAPVRSSKQFTSDREGVMLHLVVHAGEVIQARIGTSFVSVEEARRNLRFEVPDWSFDRVEHASRRAWDQQLGKISITASDEEKRIFYTALYHASQLPRIASDVSGTYPGFASPNKVERAVGFTYYDDFSLWDTFRALHPLLVLIDPKRETDMVRSLIEKGKQGGFLPMFPAWNSYTQEMLGDHAIAVIGDAYVKGLRGFDIETAYALMRKNATTLPLDRAAYLDGQGRRGLKSYMQYGYIPLEDQVPDAFHNRGQVSRTLEYAYDDFVLSEVARLLGKKDDAKLFADRAQNYRNVLNPQTGMAQGRHADGSWQVPFDPDKGHSCFVEASSWKSTFFVPQDIPGLIAIEGGPASFVNKLDMLFEKGQYEQGNEPSHHIAYLYDYAGKPEKTQLHVSEIRDQLYTDGPSGLPGNDDAGQMSAWFIFSALGFYPVTPGRPTYAIGTPKYRNAVIHLAGGRDFHIVSPNASKEDIYIERTLLNGKNLKGYELKHADLVRGGRLEFMLSSTPARLPSTARPVNEVSREP